MAESRVAIDGVEAVQEHLRRSCGADLSLYERSTLIRHIAGRRGQLRLASLENYLEYLDQQPAEARRLLDAVLGVGSGFFRDSRMWELLAREIIPAIVAGKADGEPIRVWSAGCASGEEVFTLAMVLAESMGWEQFRRRVSIYATDVSEDALAKAREATYDAEALKPVGAELRARYLERGGQGDRFRREIRRSIVFGLHDLSRDPPISRLDLLLCRNVLVYLDLQLRARVAVRLHYALNPGGVLVLGNVDTNPGAHLFEPIDPRWGVFRRTAADHEPQAVALRAKNAEPGLAGSVRLEQEAFTTLPVAQLVVDAGGTLVLANQLARALFHLDAKDLGRPFRDLDLAYRPVELRSLIDQVRIEGTEVVRRGIERSLPLEGTQCLDVRVRPLRDYRGAFLGAVISFDDTTEARTAQSRLRHASEELQSTHQELHSTSEELRTTIEELRATVEELEATNEELHAINEEHEAMNQELQSTNKMLRSMNDQLSERTEELKDSRLLLESILVNIGSGIVVVDRELRVLIWSKKMQELWGLRPDEVQGQSIETLDIGLPVSELLEPLQQCLAGRLGARGLVVRATERRGKALRCRVSMSPLTSEGQVHAVVIRVDEEPS